MGDTMTPDISIERRAQALAEVRKIHEDNMVIADENRELHNKIEQQNHRIAFLEEQLKEAQRGEKIFMRKLVQVSTCVANIGKLSRDAEEVVRQAAELMPEESSEEAATEQESAADMIRRLPVRM